MPKGKPIDVDEVHRLLLERSDRLSRLKIQQRELAVELGVTYFAICRLLSRMEEEGRIKRFASGHRNVGTYVVRPL